MKQRPNRARLAPCHGLVWAAAAVLGCSACAAQAAVRCHESAAFRVVERSHGNGPGKDFLVQPLRPGASVTPASACRYRARPGDFEIPSRDAESFAGLADAILVIDNGTGPDGRRLVLWDLQRRKQVLEAPLGEIVEVTTAHLTYWEPDDHPATDANCPQRKQWQAELLGARMQRKLKLDLPTLARHASDEQRCVPRQ